MIQLIKRMIFAWRYKRAVARACKYAKLYGRKYYVLYMGGKLKVVPKRNICELIHRHRFPMIPKDYIELLKQTDGLVWNGIELYGSRANDRRKIKSYAASYDCT